MRDKHQGKRAKCLEASKLNYLYIVSCLKDIVDREKDTISLLPSRMLGLLFENTSISNEVNDGGYQTWLFEERNATNRAYLHFNFKPQSLICDTNLHFQVNQRWE